LLNIRIISIGKDKERWITDGCEHYRKLLSRYARVELDLLPSLKASGSLSPDEVKAKEAEKLERAAGSGFLAALDDRGQAFDSISFARRLERLEAESRGSVTLLIGGAFGLDQRILKRCDWIWSLSALTFSHQLTRLIVLEQLYRGYSILHGTAYHK
jgi:23S rRNA (pseudouridine1915-N3)-methyltransferase